jgi:shikimate kinase
MGSGKTTVGRLLADELGYSFIDLDAYIENRCRKKVQAIFAEEGEAKFREIEHRILAEVSEMENVVVSTGGGAPCFFNNMNLINNSGISIYLRLSPEKLAERLDKANNQRPLLQGKKSDEMVDFIRKMLSSRESFYNQATYIVDNDVSPQDAVSIMLELL